MYYSVRKNLIKQWLRMIKSGAVDREGKSDTKKRPNSF